MGFGKVGLKRLSKYLFRDDEFRGQDLWKNLSLPQSILSAQCTLSRWISTLEWFFQYLGEPQNASVGKQPQTVQRLQPRWRRCSCDTLWRTQYNQRFPRLLLQTPKWSSLSVYILGNLSMLPLDVLPLLQGCWDQLKTSKQKLRVCDFQIVLFQWLYMTYLLYRCLLKPRQSAILSTHRFTFIFKMLMIKN